jgi:hypothetical protein
MLFADVILVDENRIEVDQKLNLSRRTLEAKGSRLSGSKMENMKCDFSVTTQEEGGVRLDGQVVPRKTHFASWDRCSKRMGISMKMLVIELKSTG